ncbi:hypothetical protein CCMA1212_003649 [Trichoderma ghanense]|uniref:Uncharacterized protein n=1 Tax=Trichoderma ghanense TaxID=65468 RepID=A0ABY2H6M7_9HYPO
MSRDTFCGGRVTSPWPPNFPSLASSFSSLGSTTEGQGIPAIRRFTTPSLYCLFHFIYSAFSRHIPNLTIAKSCSFSCSLISIVSPLCFLNHALYQNIWAAQGLIVSQCLSAFVCVPTKKKGKRKSWVLLFLSLIVAKNCCTSNVEGGRYTRLRIWGTTWHGLGFSFLFFMRWAKQRDGFWVGQ